MQHWHMRVAMQCAASTQQLLITIHETLKAMPVLYIFGTSFMVFEMLRYQVESKAKLIALCKLELK